MKTIIICGLIWAASLDIAAQPFYKDINLSDFSLQKNFNARMFQGERHYYKEYYKGFRLISIYPDFPSIAFTITNASYEQWLQVYYDLKEIFGEEKESTGFNWKMFIGYDLDVRLLYDEDLTIVIFPLGLKRK